MTGDKGQQKDAATHSGQSTEQQGSQSGKIQRTDAEWRKLLTAEQYHVLREHGTERAFTGAYADRHGPGTYVCAGCGLELFGSDEKYDSGSGWPSFYAPLNPTSVETDTDTAHGMVRTEVHCARCGGHLGHV
ncbi:MAG: peptide-methionine (R)-S-oxide reductase MsrB, partial [Polyangia bacterium]